MRILFFKSIFITSLPFNFKNLKTDILLSLFLIYTVGTNDICRKNDSFIAIFLVNLLRVKHSLKMSKTVRNKIQFVFDVSFEFNDFLLVMTVPKSGKTCLIFKKNKQTTCVTANTAVINTMRQTCLKKWRWYRNE